MLGPGVYCSRDVDKVRNYMKGGDGVILVLAVNVGHVKVITQACDRNDSWQSQGYDTAWVKPGVQQSGEEDCVRDPKRVKVITRADPNLRGHRGGILSV